MVREFCGITPHNRYFLAPMAGITDSAFRTICTEFGAAVTYTEMVSAKALVYQDKKTCTLLQIEEDHRPCIAQIFGSEPEVMAEAAQKVVSICQPMAIDINMGCPVPKIVNNGEGSALMKDPNKACRIVRAVCGAVSVPVTVKIRSGFDHSSRNAVELAVALEQSGAAAIGVHGRTRVQMYGGVSDRAIIAQVKQAVSVPVIASGDAFSPQSCREILGETGADFIMIARGALGNPRLFAECAAEEEGCKLPPQDAQMLIDIMKRHVELTCLRKGPGAMPELRKHILWYLGRLQRAKAFKPAMAAVRTLEEFYGVCREMEHSNLNIKE